MVERGRGEVEIGFRASRAPVRHGDLDRLALICGGDLLVADRVVVRVRAIITRVAVEQKVRHGGDIIGIGVGDSTAAQARGVESSLTGLGAREVTFGRIRGRRGSGSSGR